MTWLTWLNQWWCVHQDVRVADGARLYVRCLRCDRESPGITVGRRHGT